MSIIKICNTDRMKIMKQGDIWLVKYDPSVGHEYKKERPAVVISAGVTIKKSNLITVMALTGQNDKFVIDDIKVAKNGGNKLFQDSLIKVYHITSFDKTRFLKPIGQIGDVTLNKIKKYIEKHFDI